MNYSFIIHSFLKSLFFFLSLAALHGSETFHQSTDVEQGRSSSNTKDPINRPSNDATRTPFAKATVITKPKNISDELNDILVDDDEDDEKNNILNKQANERVTSFSFFGKKTVKEVPIIAEIDDKPKPLEGWLEKKISGKISLGSDWQRRYVRVDEPSYSLLYYKTSK